MLLAYKVSTKLIDCEKRRGGGSIIFFNLKQSLTFTPCIVGRGQPMACSTNYSFYLYNKFIYNFRNYPTNKKRSTFKKITFPYSKSILFDVNIIQRKRNEKKHSNNIF